MPIPGSLCDFPFLIGIPAIPPLVATWQASHAYAANALVTNDSPPNIYKCATAGTSAAAGGPTGFGSGIVDNTATWDFVSPLAPAIPGLPTITLPIPPCVLDEF